MMLNDIESSPFDFLVSFQNLYDAWSLFKKGKRNRLDVQKYELHLERYLFNLSRELQSQEYKHGKYSYFQIRDPKIRKISKAQIKDRLVHQVVFTELYNSFHKIFLPSVYSGIIGKGTHRAVDELQVSIRKQSKNYTKPCWALKCDIKRFYDSVNHQILKNKLSTRITCPKFLNLTCKVIDSFYVSEVPKAGIPLGNLTAQIFNNIYLVDFDKYIKQSLKVKFYFRYCDDFIILSNKQEELLAILSDIRHYIGTELNLKLHDKKASIHNIYRGIDFLGYVLLPHARVIRTKTKRRILKRVKNNKIKSWVSYKGMLDKADSYRLIQTIENQLYWQK